MIRRLDERTAVAGQISAAQVAGLPASGFRVLINNRPDGEEPGQPSSAEIGTAAREAGIAYREIPVAGGFSAAQIAAMAAALEEGPALAFCRSGTRSAWIWALARASRGGDVATLVGQAAEAGYDLRPILGLLRG